MSQPISEFERQQLDELHDRVLDLEPDAQNRELIERVRTAVEETELGIDTTAEEWTTVRDRTRITWGGIMQGDWVSWARDEEFSGQPNYFEFRRLRLRAKGQGYGVFDYEVELEFAPETQLEAEVVDNHVDLGGFGVEMKDVCLGIRDNPYLGYIRLGHFMVPAGLSQLTNRRSQTFLERPLPHEFVPGREVGIAAYDHTLDERITWSWGAFLHDLSESAHSTEDDNQGTRLAARLTWTPYYDESTLGRYLIHTGLSYVHTRPKAEADPSGRLLEYRPLRFAVRPEIHRGDNLIDTDRINSQECDVLDLEFAWLHGPFRLESEFVYTAVNEVGSGSTELFGAYCLASCFLTGEQRTYNRTAAVFDEVIPLENFWIVPTPCGNAAGWGAWEVAARWSYMDFSDVAGQQLHDFTLGLNWYWNPRTRLMFNWIHPFAHNSPVSTAVNAGGDILATRLEVAF